MMTLIFGKSPADAQEELRTLQTRSRLAATTRLRMLARSERNIMASVKSSEHLGDGTHKLHSQHLQMLHSQKRMAINTHMHVDSAHSIAVNMASKIGAAHVMREMNKICDSVRPPDCVDVITKSNAWQHKGDQMDALMESLDEIQTRNAESESEEDEIEVDKRRLMVSLLPVHALSP